MKTFGFLDDPNFVLTETRVILGRSYPYPFLVFTTNNLVMPISKCSNLIVFIVIVSLAPIQVIAQVELVKDVVYDANYTLGSYPVAPVNVNGVVYFRAHHPSFGSELFKSDGTTNGTVLIKDINKGQSNSIPQFIAEYENIILFSASDGAAGNELWKSDGTANGTVLVKDITPGLSDSNPFNLIKFKGFIYFTAANVAAGRELWRTDGTEAGTVLIKDVNPGPADGFTSLTTNFTVVGDWLYFNANNGSDGTELWRSDGTSAGTVLVKDLTPGPSSTEFFSLSPIDNTLYFGSNGGGMGQQLWKSDGTEVGTTIVKQYAFGNSAPSEVFKFKNKIYFAANYDGNGWELWETDGSEAGTLLVKDINVGAGSSITWSGGMPTFTVMGDYFYFAADDGVNHTQLWKSDGTTLGTIMVKRIHPTFGSFPYNFAVVNNMLFFRASGDGVVPNLNDELWKSDGTEAGTVIVKDINPNAGAGMLYLTRSGNLLFFTADDRVSGNELWRTDGTAAGTFITKDLNTSSAAYPRGLAASDNDLVFFNHPASDKVEIWKSNGSENGTTLVKAVSLGPDGAPSANATFVEGKTFFTMNDVASGHELWISDGSDAGTKIVKDIFPGPSSAYAGTNINRLSHLGNQVMFTADDGVNGTELWKSDGTESGTMMIKDLNLLRNLGPERYGVADNVFYFFDDFKLYRSDGTSGGTYLVKDINPSRAGLTAPDPFVFNNGKLYFAADDGVHGLEIWTSDGSEAGTFMLKDIFPGNEFTYAKVMGTLNGTIYLSVNDGVHGVELWKSDGTEAGTVMLKDINPGGWSLPMYFATMGNSIYFTATDGERGKELWKSDGTEAGTVLVKDIFGGHASSNIQWLISFKGLVYFSAEDGTHGSELWRSDGTAQGTYMVADINPVANGSFPSEITAGKDWIYFTAEDGSHGRDVWKFNPSGISIAPIPDKIATDPPFNLDLLSYSGLPVTLTVVSGPATVSGLTITLTGSGVVTIKATHPGNDQYPASEVQRSFNVVKATQTITFESVSTKTTTDAPFELKATSSSGLPITFTVVSGPATISGNTLSLLGTPGDVTVNASQSGNNIYEPKTVDQTFEVTPIVGVEEQKAFKLKIFPNPSSGRIHVELEHANVSASLMNAIGQVVWSSNDIKETSLMLQVSDLPKGLYIFRVHDEADTYAHRVMLE